MKEAIRTMSYAIVEIELTQPLRPVTVRDNESGVALILRQRGRPVGFVMHAIDINRTLEPTQLRELISNAQVPPNATLSQQPGATAAFGRELPSLTIAVCTKDRPEDLRVCLDQLKKVRSAEADGGAGIELLVVDNAPSDSQTRELVESLGDVRYATDPRPGLDFARNAAIAEARGELLAFVDDDVRVDSRWLRGLRRALTEHPEAGAVTGLVLPAELRTEAQILFEKRGGFQKTFATVRYGEELPGHPFYPCIGGKFGTGCNMAFRRSLLQDLGGFDEALDAGAALPGGGDTDMFYRVVRSGHPLIYEPEFQVFHRHRTEIAQLRRQYCRSWGQGLMAFVSKTYRYDIEQRPNLRRLAGWWFRNAFQEILNSLRGRHVLSPDMLFAELWGGIIGLFVAYGRSQDRATQIRLEHHHKAKLASV